MCEYKMSKKLFDAICATRKGEEKKMRPQDYVLKVVNEQYGLRWPCRRVIIDNK